MDSSSPAIVPKQTVFKSSLIPTTLFHKMHLYRENINTKFVIFMIHSTRRTTMNYYLVNLSMADLMITLWCPAQSLVRELSDHNGYILPAIFCKIGVFYTGSTVTMIMTLMLTLTLLPVLCMVSSVMTLSAISCDRFLAVICPLRTRVTQRKARY